MVCSYKGDFLLSVVASINDKARCVRHGLEQVHLRSVQLDLLNDVFHILLLCRCFIWSAARTGGAHIGPLRRSLAEHKLVSCLRFVEVKSERELFFLSFERLCEHAVPAL